MILKKFYRPKGIDLGSLRAVRDALTNSLEWGLASAKYRLYYPGEEIVAKRIDQVESLVKDRGHPVHLWAQFKSQGGRTLTLDATDPSRVIIEVDNLDKPPWEVLNIIEPALRLEPIDELSILRPTTTAFVAHSFDQEGHNCATEVSRFLTLNGLKVYSGRVFSATKVSEKVQAHLAKHDIIVAILTSTDDPTWLIQEMATAVAHKKPLFILKQEGTSFKEGLLGDYEYIPFPKGQISKTFIPILEGLAQLRGIDVKDRSDTI